jgi:hypothetical protein
VQQQFNEQLGGGGFFRVGVGFSDGFGQQWQQHPELPEE